MPRPVALLTMGCVLLTGCLQRPGPPVVLQGAPPEPPPEPARPKRPAGPLERKASFDFEGVPFPEVIGRLARERGVTLGVSQLIPAEQWGQHKVTLRMADVTVRSLLDWLVRPLGAEYAVEEKGRVWLTRGDDLLVNEPLEVRTYQVPTHFRSTRPIRGTLSYAKEQRVILATLERCLRYLLDHREGCRLAFHGEHDILVARLPAPGHQRLVVLLDAMRHGSDPPGLPDPALHQLRARLKAPVQCDWPPQPIDKALARVADQCKVNLGWDAPRLGSPKVALPQGTPSLRQVLDAVVQQTKLARYRLEPGHGIWLYLEGQEEDFPETGGTVWDRAVVRAYDILPLLLHSRPETIMDRLHKAVDPGQWAHGLPAAAIFTPTARLIVVHDPPGHRRVASVVQEMLQEAARPPERP